MRYVPILTYHEISAKPQPTYLTFTVTPAQFDRQMQWLAENDYSTITLDHLLDHRAGRRALPKRPIVITFDDGCREAIEHAMATLPKYGFTAMFYLVTGVIGGATRWTKTKRDFELPVVDWRTAQQLIASGFSCGSHTVNHRRLAQVAMSECREELFQSRATLEDRLGQDIVHLSYPHGSFNAGVRQIAEEAGYRTAVTVEPGLSCETDDALALRRVRVSGDEKFRDFKLRVRTGKRLEELLPKRVSSLAVRASRLLRLQHC